MRPPDTVKPPNTMRPPPKYPGRFVGQVATHDERVATGKRYPMETPDGVVWIPVKEVRTVTDWVWTGLEWVTQTEWHARNPRTAPEGTKFPSKRDVDMNGMAVRRYGRRPEPDAPRPSRPRAHATLVWDGPHEDELP